MSDLLAPILYVLDNEVDAFWCFVAYMERVVMLIIIINLNYLISANHSSTYCYMN